MSASREDVEVTLKAIEEAKRLGPFVKANNPAMRGVMPPNPRTETRDGLHIDHDVAIATRDGVTLYGSIYRSSSMLHEKLPVLLNYCVYGKDGGLEIAMFPPSSRLDPARTGAEYLFEGADALWWCPRGYAVAIVDSRGSFLSEGDKFIWGRVLGLDGYDIVEWLAAQEWSNGKVGMYGASAYAIVQWFTAAEQPPHLAAIMPYDGMTDMYREWVHKGGIPETQFQNLYPSLFNWGNGLVEDSLTAATEHPYFDDYWKSKMPPLDRIVCPAYIICSWGDHCVHTRGTINGYYGIKSEIKYLELHQYQKWDFAVAPESLSRQKAFFDKLLRGMKSEVDFWPKVRYTVREAFYVGEWREAETFPLPETQYTEYFPTPSQALSRIPQPAQHKISYDALSEEAIFELPVAQSLEFVGHSKLKLWVEADGADNLDLFVTLRKVDADGQPVHFPWLTIIPDGPVAFGFLRVSRRELDEEKSSPWQPYHSHARDLPPLKKGEVVPVEIEILPTSCRLRPGERLQLCVTGHDYHEYPPNIPVSRHPHHINKGRHIIHFGGKYDSSLLLPVQPPVKNSYQEKKKHVKLILSGTRPKSLEVHQKPQGSVDNYGATVRGLALQIPFLQAYTQLVPTSNETIAAIGGDTGDHGTAAVIGWSSLTGLMAVHHPGFRAGTQEHLMSEGVKQVGSIATVLAELNFDPVEFNKRNHAFLVITYMPKAEDLNSEAVETELMSRVEIVKKVGAGTGLLRYVLNIDITPPNPSQLFAGSMIADTGLGSMVAVEQFWFDNAASATSFFSDSDRKTELEDYPKPVARDRVFRVCGQEAALLAKDLNF